MLCMHVFQYIVPFLFLFVVFRRFFIVFYDFADNVNLLYLQSLQIEKQIKCLSFSFTSFMQKLVSLAAIQLCDQYIIICQLFRKRNKRGRKQTKHSDALFTLCNFHLKRNITWLPCHQEKLKNLDIDWTFGPKFENSREFKNINCDLQISAKHLQAMRG